MAKVLKKTLRRRSHSTSSGQAGQATKAKSKRTMTTMTGKAKMQKAKKHAAKRKMMVKKVTKKVTKKLVKKISAGKKPKMPGMVGKVVHYYDRIGVAIVELTGPVMVGDILIFRRGEREFIQPVSSMQINHTSVEKAGKGKVVGIKVVQVADPGTFVLHG